MEYSSKGEANTPFMPFPECGSMSQGYIGYGLQQCIQNELKKKVLLIMRNFNNTSSSGCKR